MYIIYMANTKKINNIILYFLTRDTNRKYIHNFLDFKKIIIDIERDRHVYKTSIICLVLQLGELRITNNMHIYIYIHILNIYK